MPNLFSVERPSGKLLSKLKGMVTGRPQYLLYKMMGAAGSDEAMAKFVSGLEKEEQTRFDRQLASNKGTFRPYLEGYRPTNYEHILIPRDAHHPFLWAHGTTILGFRGAINKSLKTAPKVMGTNLFLKAMQLFVPLQAALLNYSIYANAFKRPLNMYANKQATNAAALHAGSNILLAALYDSRDFYGKPSKLEKGKYVRVKAAPVDFFGAARHMTHLEFDRYGSPVLLRNPLLDLKGARGFKERAKHLGAWVKWHQPFHRFRGRLFMPTEEEFLAMKAELEARRKSLRAQKILQERSPKGPQGFAKNVRKDRQYKSALGKRGR